MATETWEEIREWEIEEDFDFAQRITVHAIPNPASSEDEGDGDEYQFIQTFKAPTYAAAAKLGLRLHASSDSDDAISVAIPSIKNKAARRAVAPKKPVAVNKTPESSVHIEDAACDDSLAGATLESRETRSATRRTNTTLAKLQSKRLQSQLVNRTQLEYWESTTKGDTNRNSEFVKAKVANKAMRYHKGKKEKKGFQKSRVDTW